MTKRIDPVVKANRKKVLYCTECCTTFTLNDEGNWIAKPKVAEIIAGSFLQCTCGQILGIINKQEKPYLVGEVIPTT